METAFIWKAAVLLTAGIFCLRIAGRKSISQMTLAQTVVMISLGTIIVQPIVERSILKAIGAAIVFVIVIVLLEWLQVRWNGFEKMITGKSKIVIQDGKLDVENLKKLRITADQIEMRMRTQGLTKLSDIKIATIEPNGQLGYELTAEAKPLTVGEFKKLLQNNIGNNNMPTIFEEIKQQKHRVDHPDKLT